jgi:hypothetical protein
MIQGNDRAVEPHYHMRPQRTEIYKQQARKRVVYEGSVVRSNARTKGAVPGKLPALSLRLSKASQQRTEGPTLLQRQGLATLSPTLLVLNLNKLIVAYFMTNASLQPFLVYYVRPLSPLKSTAILLQPVERRPSSALTPPTLDSSLAVKQDPPPLPCSDPYHCLGDRTSASRAHRAAAEDAAPGRLRCAAGSAPD